jgi:amino acid transporter
VVESAGAGRAVANLARARSYPIITPRCASRSTSSPHKLTVFKQNWYASAITLCAEISAASIVIQYWKGAENISVAVWISIIIVLVVCLNIFAIQIYGEAEFIFASVKIITIVGLLIMAFIVDLGGNPKHDRLGFRFWKNPGAMKEYDSTGDTGRFLGLFSVLVNAAFSYGGVELVAVAAGEAENPRKNIPKAVRRVFWRILFFYVLGSLAIGVLVASNDEHLLAAQAAGSAGAAQSPWVIGIVNAGIPVLPSIINAVILTSASSSANAFLYTGSRYLFALAQNKQAPRFLLRCSKAGVPYWCVAITASIAGLTYLSVRDGGPALVFAWFQNLTTIASLFTWCSICVAYLFFYKALKAQGVDRNTLVFKSVYQPYTAWFALIYFSVIIIFNGFDVFVGEHHRKWDITGRPLPLPYSMPKLTCNSLPRCVYRHTYLLCSFPFLEGFQAHTHH